MRVRTAPLTLAAALVIVGGLSACSTVQTADSCDPILEAGAVSDRVVVLGEAGTVPQVSVPTGAVPKVSQRTFVQQAESRDRVVTEGDLVTLNFGFYNGLNGDQVYATPGFGSDQGGIIAMDEVESEISAFTSAFRCAAVGDRVVVALSAEDSLPFAQGYNFMAGTPLVAVADVQGISGISAEGDVKSLPAGFPGIASNAEGQPGVIIPPGSQPTKIVSASRIVGEGKQITPEDNVIAQVLVVDWNREVLVNSWETGPQSIGAEVAAEGAQQQVEPYRAALTGATVGSQVVVMMPAEGGAHIAVVDILAAG